MPAMAYVWDAIDFIHFKPKESSQHVDDQSMNKAIAGSLETLSVQLPLCFE